MGAEHRIVPEFEGAVFHAYVKLIGVGVGVIGEVDREIQDCGNLCLETLYVLILNARVDVVIQ
jgi:hypothetical protein